MQSVLYICRGLFPLLLLGAMCNRIDHLLIRILGFHIDIWSYFLKYLVKRYFSNHQTRNLILGKTSGDTSHHKLTTLCL